VPIDPVSEADDFQTDFTRRFIDDPEAQAAIASSHKLSQLEMSDFDAILHPGGQGPFWDIVSDSDSIRLIEAAWAQKKVVAAICHGVCALLDAKNDNGDLIVSGSNVTGFSNAEEKEYGTDVVVPFLLQTELEKRGANYTQAANWTAYTRQDGRLITGQNPASSEQVAQLLLNELRN
jgi:putative intracellular protease/amidase